jgi:FkbM family methyltransferase
MYFSQCGEDWFLNTNYFHDMKNGFYIELGALDGVLYSNTKFFEEQLGWTGILIEPHPFKFKALERNRPNNHLFNNLVSCIDEPLNFRYFADSNAAVSGVESTLSDHHITTYYNEEYAKYFDISSVMIHPRSLSSIIKSIDMNRDHIDLLSLDVEGHELEVLQSWDFSIPIKVILIEMLGVDIARDEMCRKLLLKKGYRMDKKYKHNEVWIL